MPGPFICLIAAYLVGEVWIGVCIAVVIELVPSDLTTSAVAIYFFIIQIIGGNMNLLVPPIEQSLGLQYAMLIMYPGMYIVGALFFVSALLVVTFQQKKNKHAYTAGREVKTSSDDDPAIHVSSTDDILSDACAGDDVKIAGTSMNSQEDGSVYSRL